VPGRVPVVAQPDRLGLRADEAALAVIVITSPALLGIRTASRAVFRAVP